MKSRIDKAVATLRGYCDKVKNCNKCRFVTQDGQCPFMQEEPPCDWEMDDSDHLRWLRWTNSRLRRLLNATRP